MEVSFGCHFSFILGQPKDVGGDFGVVAAIGAHISSSELRL
jgi:hypothetical protein